jgi:uncharacterized membrane protein YhaH (DUF805 family)
MQRLVCHWRRLVRCLRDMPECQLLEPGVGLSLVWELLQSPFYTDTFEVPWTTLVFNRLHCTGGDAMILLVAFWIVALGWGRCWVHTARWVAFVAFLALGGTYTAVSEHLNVHVLARWAYSQWMPVIGGIGLMPLLQWIVVPALCIYFVRRKTWNREGENDVRNTTSDAISCSDVPQTERSPPVPSAQ